ncbi:MAG: hypothetical protein JO265_01605 [Acidimicrobiia bacterium]|nr:hypothetical protein [Acidimicrobiia bacterium]
MDVRTSRWKAGAVALACAALTALFASEATSTPVAWVGVFVVGLGVIAACKQAVLPATVFRLEDDSLVILGGVRPRPPIPWRQVQTVEIGRRRGLRPSFVGVTVGTSLEGARRVQFSDTWLDASAEAIGREIARRADAPFSQGDR